MQVDNLYLPRLDVPVLQGGEQAVVGGGDKRHRNAFADQIFRFSDIFLHHQRFGIAELRGQQEDFDGHLLTGRNRQRAGAEITNLYVAGGQRPHNADAAVELTPVHFSAARFLKGFIRLRHFRGFR